MRSSKSLIRRHLEYPHARNNLNNFMYLLEASMSDSRFLDFPIMECPQFITYAHITSRLYTAYLE